MVCFTGEFHQTFKKIYLNSSQTFPNTLYETNIILIPKPDKDSTRKTKQQQHTHTQYPKLQANIANEYWYKASQQSINKPNSTIWQKGSYTMIKRDSSLECNSSNPNIIWHSQDTKTIRVFLNGYMGKEHVMCITNICTQWNIIQLWEWKKSFHLLQHV